MTVILPGMTQAQERVRVIPGGMQDTLLESFKTRNMNNLIVLHNKTPVWNEETQSYVLNFHGRVTHASVKNFQVVHDSDSKFIFLSFYFKRMNFSTGMS